MEFGSVFFLTLTFKIIFFRGCILIQVQKIIFKILRLKTCPKAFKKKNYLGLSVFKTEQLRNNLGHV